MLVSTYKLDQGDVEFLMMVSREMRPSLRGILDSARQLSEAPLPAEQQDYIHTILASVEGMFHILNDTLDLSCIEERDFRIESQPFAGRAEDVSILSELWMETRSESNI